LSHCSRGPPDRCWKANPEDHVKRLCVFAGSSPGARPAYRECAKALGAALVRNDLTLVYGGAKVGLMGLLADTVLDCGGSVIGVIPKSLVSKEVAHDGLSELKVVSSMHERKQLMADLADGFIALPGGMGTVEELTEILTWAQLGLHARPCGLLNVAGYFSRLIDFLDHAVTERFLKVEHRAMLLVEEDPEVLLERFVSYRAPRLAKWLDRDGT